jgi:hypothetical protein
MKIIFIILVMLSGNIYAQKLMPNNVDLRAAYCISSGNAIVNLLTSFVGSSPTEPLGKEAKKLVEWLSEERNKLKRMQGYLIPRMEYLATEPLMIAANQFKIDMKNIESCQNRNKCTIENIEKCTEACRKESGLGEKLGQCDNVAWLPY